MSNENRMPIVLLHREVKTGHIWLTVERNYHYLCGIPIGTNFVRSGSLVYKVESFVELPNDTYYVYLYEDDDFIPEDEIYTLTEDDIISSNPTAFQQTLKVFKQNLYIIRSQNTMVDQNLEIQTDTEEESETILLDISTEDDRADATDEQQSSLQSMEEFRKEAEALWAEASIQNNPLEHPPVPIVIVNIEEHHDHFLVKLKRTRRQCAVPYDTSLVLINNQTYQTTDMGFFNFPDDAYYLHRVDGVDPDNAYELTPNDLTSSLPEILRDDQDEYHYNKQNWYQETIFAQNTKPVVILDYIGDKENDTGLHDRPLWYRLFGTCATNNAGQYLTLPGNLSAGDTVELDGKIFVIVNPDPLSRGLPKDSHYLMEEFVDDPEVLEPLYQALDKKKAHTRVTHQRYTIANSDYKHLERTPKFEEEMDNPFVFTWRRLLTKEELQIGAHNKSPRERKQILKYTTLYHPELPEEDDSGTPESKKLRADVLEPQLWVAYSVILGSLTGIFSSLLF